MRHVTDVVIGGWVPGEGRREHLGALLIGYPAAAAAEGGDAEQRLVPLGRVGTGFDEMELDHLRALLAERSTQTSPFVAGADLPKRARFVEPDLVCAVEYTERTTAGRLRAPSYKGLRDVPWTDVGAPSR